MQKEFLLLCLFACHFLADYTELSTTWMLKAKQFGKPLFPIFVHAGVHGFLMFFVLMAFRIPILTVGALWLFQIITHFLIDVGKGKVTYHFPGFHDNMKRPYWRLMGFDQLLHAAVIITMAYYALK